MERIWIYMCSRRITDDELPLLYVELNRFMGDWNAHGNKLDASFEIIFNHFIIIKANEEKITASGCSIDDSVRFMTGLDLKYKLGLFNRRLVGWLNTQNEVNTIDLDELGRLYKSHILTDNTIVFNNTLQNGEDLPLKWKQPLKESPYNRLLS